MSGNSHPTEKANKLQTLTLIEELNGGYVCAPDAGPAWRAAYEAGVDMALLEENLSKTPAERLAWLSSQSGGLSPKSPTDKVVC